MTPRVLAAAPASIALAWVLAKGLLPVIGPRHLAQLEANLAARTLTLAPTHVARLDEASAVPHGYPYDILRQVRERAGIIGSTVGSVR